MFKASKALSENQVATYYKEEFTARESATYYTQSNTLTGQWHGDLAKQFGLEGEITQEHYERLLRGQNPHTGEQLISHDIIKRKDRTELGPRAGWDLTIAPHKSISVTALVGGDQGLLQDHDESVHIALNAAQEYTQARM